MTQFVEGVDFRFVIGSFGRKLKRAMREGLAEHANVAVYSRRPNGHPVEIPVNNRKAAIDALASEWAKECPLQTHLGFTLDRDGEIGLDTIELCHFEAR